MVVIFNKKDSTLPKSLLGSPLNCASKLAYTIDNGNDKSANNTAYIYNKHNKPRPRLGNSSRADRLSRASTPTHPNA
jgi:hypothetical protein